MSVLYYAIGGGLGHLTRARAVLHALGCQLQAVILTASEHSDDPRVTGDIPVLRAPNHEPSYRAWLRDTMARSAPERVIVDTFPAGLFGEIDEVRVDYVARYLRWNAYGPRRLPRFERTYVLEELDEEHQRVIDEQSSEVIGTFELEDPPVRSAALPPLPQTFVLVIHSGPAAEIGELLAYAKDVCFVERVSDPIILCAPRAVHRPDVACVDVYPATLLASRAVRIFTGGGFNAMRQFGGDARHRPMPFPRRFDDQYRRVARWRAGRGGSWTASWTKGESGAAY